MLQRSQNKKTKIPFIYEKNRDLCMKEETDPVDLLQRHERYPCTFMHFAIDGTIECRLWSLLRLHQLYVAHFTAVAAN